MIRAYKWFQRQFLVRKGFAISRQREIFPVSSPWHIFFEQSGVVRYFILLLFTCCIFALWFWKNLNHMQETILFIFMGLACAFISLRITQKDIWASNSKISLLFGIGFLNIFLNVLVFSWLLSGQNTFYHHTGGYVLTIPIATFLTTIILGRKAGFYITLFLAAFNMLVMGQGFPLFFSEFFIGITAIQMTSHIRKRWDILRAGVVVGLVGFITCVSFCFIKVESFQVFTPALLVFGVCLLTALVVNSILPVFEGIFGITTNISWIEMADLNHPLLRELSFKAPGTYHHSLMVAQLSEAAARKIGANPTLCRVMAYFHDIGKLKKPEYFSENIGQQDPHKDIPPHMSALIIIAHVKEGVDMAIKHHLKQEIIDAIQEHHGDSLVYYFYRRAQQQYQDAQLGMKIFDTPEQELPELSESAFRYPGPTPHTREIALLCLADSIEAASRALDKPTPQRIDDLVHTIIQNKIETHQLNSSHLTFNEIEEIAKSFTFSLKTILHTRIAYPKNEKNGSSTHSSESTKKHSHSS